MLIKAEIVLQGEQLGQLYQCVTDICNQLAKLQGSAKRHEVEMVVTQLQLQNVLALLNLAGREDCDGECSDPTGS
jgi:hypothetical protein